MKFIFDNINYFNKIQILSELLFCLNQFYPLKG